MRRAACARFFFRVCRRKIQQNVRCSPNQESSTSDRDWITHTYDLTIFCFHFSSQPHSRHSIADGGLSRVRGLRCCANADADSLGYANPERLAVAERFAQRFAQPDSISVTKRFAFAVRQPKRDASDVFPPPHLWRQLV